MIGLEIQKCLFDIFAKFYGEEDPASASDRILASGSTRVTRQERFVWRLASRMTSSARVDLFKSIHFWVGYFFALRECPQLLWAELETALGFKSAQVLKKMRYFETLENCQKVIDRVMADDCQVTVEDALTCTLTSLQFTTSRYTLLHVLTSLSLRTR